MVNWSKAHTTEVVAVVEPTGKALLAIELKTPICVTAIPAIKLNDRKFLLM